MYSVQLKLSVHSPHCLYCQLVHLTWMFFSLDTRKWFPATVFRFKSRPLNILSLHIEVDGNSSKCIRANLAQGNTSQSLPTRYQVGMSAYTIHGQTFLTMLSVCSQISMYQSKAPMLSKAAPNTVTQSNTYIHGHQPIGENSISSESRASKLYSVIRFGVMERGEVGEEVLYLILWSAHTWQATHISSQHSMTQEAKTIHTQSVC